jgi:hypothetical protein
MFCNFMILLSNKCLGYVLFFVFAKYVLLNLSILCMCCILCVCGFTLKTLEFQIENWSIM